MNRRELKARHAELNESEPFTDKQREAFSKKDLSFIRNIQILNNSTKQKAIAAFKRYKLKSPDAVKKLARATRKRIKAYYPKEEPFVRGRVKQQHKKPPTQRTVNTNTVNRRKTNTYLKNPANKTKKNYARVLKSSKKYIDASQFEHEHGVNSKASQKYRERIGLNTQYEGRIIK